ncbi:epididymal-specific lipocalin-6 isoform X5 [Ovis canadensis]|uniref:epididymal-specific lipocalin-6 isoform X5 n=1 Tax=Ovis canadensis TaxID=37174 RepID=UPI003750420A
MGFSRQEDWSGVPLPSPRQGWGSGLSEVLPAKARRTDSFIFHHFPSCLSRVHSTLEARQQRRLGAAVCRAPFPGRASSQVLPLGFWGLRQILPNPLTSAPRQGWFPVTLSGQPGSRESSHVALGARPGSRSDLGLGSRAGPRTLLDRATERWLPGREGMVQLRAGCSFWKLPSGGHWRSRAGTKLMGSWYVLAVASGGKDFALERATRSVEGVEVMLTSQNTLKMRASRHRLERCHLQAVELRRQNSGWVFGNPSLGVLEYRVLGTNFRDYAIVFTQLEAQEEAFSTVELYSRTALASQEALGRFAKWSRSLGFLSQQQAELQRDFTCARKVFP